MISKSKNQEEMNTKICESGHKLGLFIEFAPFSMAMLDKDMNYLAVSKNWIKEYHLEGKELIGKSHYDLFSDMPESWKEAHSLSLQGEYIQEENGFFQNISDESKWIVWKIRPWYTQDDQIGGIIILSEDMTEQKKIEDRYHTLFNKTGTCAAIIEPDGTFSLVNQTFADLAESTVEDFTGSSFIDLVDDVDKERVVGYHKKRLNSQVVPEHYELNFVTTKGKKGVALVNAVFLPETMQTLVSIIDITDRKHIESELIAREKELTAVIDNIPMMIFLKDAKDLRYVRFNNAGEKLTGISKDALFGKSDYDFFPKEEADFFTSRDREVLDEKTVLDIPEEPIHTHEGERILHTKKVAILDENGEAKYLLGISEDITERKQKENQLLQSYKVIENLAEGIIITDAKANILSVNPAFSEITGYSKEEAIGQNTRLLKSGRHEYEFYTNMWKTLLQGDKWQGEIWNKRKNGQLFPEWLSISSIKNERNKIVNYICVFADISNIKKTEDELRFLAHYDTLTELPNRLLLTERLEHSLERAHRKRENVAVLYLDIDRFKEINDSLGHPYGDLLLQKVAKKIEDLLREEDTIARVSGDEFVMIIEDVKSPNDAAIVAQKILVELNDPMTLNEHEVTITVSMGVAVSPMDGTDAVTLLKNADTALYRAKDLGRNSFEFFSADMATSSFELLYLHSALHNALKNDEFVVYYQPQFEMQTGELLGAEALVRWNSHEMGLVPPGRFIPLAEDTGLIVALGEWILRQACFQMKKWLDAGMPLKYIAVNVSGRQLSRDNIVETLRKALSDAQLDAKYIEIEITESVIMKDELYIDLLNSLKELGVRLSIDDFGTGYSSLSRLKHMPIDKLKIDQSFVSGIPFDKDDMNITQAIIGLADSLELDVIAEGVETKEQAEFLVKEGCKKVQGYLYSLPLTVVDLEEWMSKNTHKKIF